MRRPLSLTRQQERGPTNSLLWASANDITFTSRGGGIIFILKASSSSSLSTLSSSDDAPPQHQQLQTPPLKKRRHSHTMAILTMPHSASARIANEAILETAMSVTSRKLSAVLRATLGDGVGHRYNPNVALGVCYHPAPHRCRFPIIRGRQIKSWATTVDRRHPPAWPPVRPLFIMPGS